MSICELLAWTPQTSPGREFNLVQFWQLTVRHSTVLHFPVIAFPYFTRLFNGHRSTPFVMLKLGFNIWMTNGTKVLTLDPIAQSTLMQALLDFTLSSGQQ